MEDQEYFCDYDSIVGVKIAGTDRLFLLDFDEKNYHEKFNEKFGGFEIAGLYLLINSEKKEIYVGESTNVKTRNESEIKNGLTGKLKDFKFDKIILIWDGRPTTTSNFGGDSFRKWLEKDCIQIFDDDDSYECVNSTKKKKPTSYLIETKVERFKKDLSLLLNIHGLINTRN